MLTAATLGMIAYGLYSAGTGLVDLLATRALEVWIDLAMLLFGLMLTMAAFLVRVLMPGGLALAIGAMLGLQALAIHNAAHLYGQVVPLPLVARGAFAAALVLLAYIGARTAKT